MEDKDMNWRKASYSSNGGANCVEVASTDRVVIRDTTDRDGGMLTVTAAAWREFLASVRLRVQGSSRFRAIEAGSCFLSGKLVKISLSRLSSPGYTGR